jgi:large subunit ribosomal protein L36e
MEFSDSSEYRVETLCCVAFFCVESSRCDGSSEAYRSLRPGAEYIIFFTVYLHCLICIRFTLLLLQKLGKRVSMCRTIAREVVGLSPYERRILDMIKTGGSSADKRIYKFAKNRLGSHKRALAKREDIKEVNSAQRARAAGA